MLKFSEILNHAKENMLGMNVINEGKSYFTIENEEGYKAYFQVECFGYHYDDPKYYRGFQFSTRHKPNPNTGVGIQHKFLNYNATIEEIEEAFYSTLEQSKRNILSGRVKF